MGMAGTLWHNLKLYCGADKVLVAVAMIMRHAQLLMGVANSQPCFFSALLLFSLALHVTWHSDSVVRDAITYGIPQLLQFCQLLLCPAARGSQLGSQPGRVRGPAAGLVQASAAHRRCAEFMRLGVRRSSFTVLDAWEEEGTNACLSRASCERRANLTPRSAEAPKRSKLCKPWMWQA